MAKERLHSARENAASPASVDLGRGRRNASRNQATKRQLADAVVIARDACRWPAGSEDGFDPGVNGAKRALLVDKASPSAAVPAVRGPGRRSSSRAIIRKVLPGEEPGKVMPSKSRTDATTVAANGPLVAATDSASDHHEALLKVPQQSLHRCLHCNKAFMSRYGLVVHLDVHPKYAVRCSWCEIVFPSHRGLVTHRRMKHADHYAAAENNHVAALATASSAGDCAAANSSAGSARAAAAVTAAPQLMSSPEPVSAGFSDLTFADFSCRSFPLIAQYWCERRPRPTASAFHDFTCTECKAAFPIASALQLHMSKAHEMKEGHVCSTCGREFSSLDSLQFHQLPAGTRQSEFLQNLQLFPACIRSRDVCVDDTHLNTAYYALLAKHRDGDQATGAPSDASRRASSSAQAGLVDRASSAATSSRGSMTLANVGGSSVKNGQLRKSRQS